jgi:hypothetical protein
MIRFLAAVGTLLSLVTLVSISSSGVEKAAVDRSVGWAGVAKTHHQFDCWT